MGECHSREPPTTVVVVVVDLDTPLFTRELVFLKVGEGCFLQYGGMRFTGTLNL